MSSTFHDDFASFAQPDLLDEFGRSVTHQPYGRSGDSATITAIWTENTPSEATDVGRRTYRTGTLQIPEAVSVDPRDQFVIDGETWDVEGKPPGALGGLRPVELVRHDEEVRRAQPNRRY